MQAIGILLAAKVGMLELDDLLVVDPDEPECDETDDIGHCNVCP
jgi:hypothetical protein